MEASTGSASIADDSVLAALTERFEHYRDRYSDGLYPNIVIERSAVARHRTAVAALARQYGWTIHYVHVPANAAASADDVSQVDLRFEAGFTPATTAGYETFS